MLQSSATTHLEFKQQKNDLGPLSVGLAHAWLATKGGACKVVAQLAARA